MLVLGGAVSVSAQGNQAPAANAVLISQTRSGNTVTSRYKIPHNDGKRAEFDMYYTINKSNIQSNYLDNSQQIADLKDFMEQTKDTTMHISAIHIVGYASPDGNAKQNNTLASKRAQALYHYAVNTYHPEHKIDTDYKTFKWSDCAAVVEKSDIPQKDEVLAILNSTQHTEPQKEMALRKLPDAWGYLTSYILPQMRYADIEFDYGVDEYITRTSVVPAESEQPAQTTQPKQGETVVIDEEMGIIIATPRHSVKSEEKSEKQDQRKARKENKKETKEVKEVIYW